ncbi:unnamed protein product [Rotaria magnacalcarata]|uniref:Uncharacterized protein n=1 Tax=Rotaria magnacalcarata TaxID=392030 RepID=A0A819JZN7_9BILA|nr:unnamed protein product [Rotaria magnacalcarata]CAF3995561.1 unnamed protein product [Rotaria magnacalcarata]CAF4850891.1 unnamed protein product [Rotaria magnacalcarata]CAF4876279.1 unnamed protein product [Rotaria magnacalcarata]
MLLSWYATIDLAELYEMFYNGTSFWFGPFCRFKFDYSLSQSFYDIVKISFNTKRALSPNSEVPCELPLLTMRDYYSNPNFICEEFMRRPGHLEFPCGDGESTNGIVTCENGRSSILRNDFRPNTIH